jgi:hypothetical protein
MIAALGYGSNPSGTTMKLILDGAGVRTVKEGSGRGAKVRYYPGEDEATG